MVTNSLKTLIGFRIGFKLVLMRFMMLGFNIYQMYPDTDFQNRL